MDSIEILYDHYKETITASNAMQGKRNRLFVWMCGVELINFVMLLFPEVAIQILTQYFENEYQLTIGTLANAFPTAIWLVLCYLLVRYYQTNIYIERQYNYISLLETQISEIAKINNFNREGNGYLTDYPLVLDIIHAFYTWAIPLFFIVTNIIRIVIEFRSTPILFFVIDAVICLFVVILSILYLSFLHPPKKGESHSSKK